MTFEFKKMIDNFQHAAAVLLADYLAHRRQIEEPAA
jgi:hypothetical protein